MKIKRESPRKRILLIALATILLLTLGYLAYAYTSHSWPWQPVNGSPSSQATQDKTSDKPSDATNDSTTPTSPTGPNKTPPQYESNSGQKNDSSQLSGVINYKDVSDSTLSIRITIDQKLDEGSCKLTLIRQSDGKGVQKSAEITPNPSSASCKGFDIPTSELGQGTWDIKIAIKSGDSTGTIKGDIAI